MDWLDTYSDPSVKAASVVTNLWIAAFAITSALFALLGAVVALQWPNPRILCYKTSYSDRPSNSITRTCCSLYSLNLGFTVFWLLVFAIMVIARDVVRIIICLCFWVVHVAVVITFRMKFKRYGRPELPLNSTVNAASGSSTAQAGSLGPGQAVGIPVYNIPMQTVVLGPSSSDGANAATAAAAGGSQPPPYWYDANCIPPAQGAGVPGQPVTAAPAGGLLSPPCPQQAPVYPPQPAAAAAEAGYSSGLVLGQPVSGVPVVPPAGAAGTGRPSAEGGGPAGGATGAAAGAAAAAGAGAVGARGQQPR